MSQTQTLPAEEGLDKNKKEANFSLEKNSHYCHFEKYRSNS